MPLKFQNDVALCFWYTCNSVPYILQSFIQTSVVLCFVSGLAVGLGIGALAEVAKKSLRSDDKNGKIITTVLIFKQ